MVVLLIAPHVFFSLSLLNTGEVALNKLDASRRDLATPILPEYFAVNALPPGTQTEVVRRILVEEKQLFRLFPSS